MSIPERQRRFMRYVTFAPLANAGLADAELRTHTQALAQPNRPSRTPGAGDMG